MSEEIPPSALTRRPSGPPPPAPPRPGDDVGRGSAARGSGTWYTLRLTVDRWAAVAQASPFRATLTVVGAWLILAWNRFGFQGVEQPRVMIRFALIGVWGWLGLTAVIALVVLVLRPLIVAGGDEARAADHVANGTVPRWPDVAGRLLQVSGLSHVALLVLAIAIQIGQAVPIPLIVPLLTALVLLAWFPGMLVIATTEAVLRQGRGIARPVTITAVVVPVYVVWLATVGRYLVEQLGHLI
ncbi:MAG: hypothetical protein AAF531_25220 [Actinomycetota bacterium]